MRRCPGCIEQFAPIVEEFDDYIAKPKANGYQSLHTIVRDQAGRAIEIQIRTQAMHDHAEHGVAAHWAYKEAGSKGYAGVSASGEYDAKIAVLRQLLAWERDLAGSGAGPVRGPHLCADARRRHRRIAAGRDAGRLRLHRAHQPGPPLPRRRVDGAMVPLNTPLQNGQTVEITAAKEGGPSRDWLNADLGFLASHRAKAKVRAWFNEQIRHETVARGREAVEKLLQREGKTAVKLEDLASQLGFKSAEDLFAVVGKDEYSLRNIETLLRPPEAPLAAGRLPVAEEGAPRRENAQGRRAGGGHRFADDAAGQVLQAGAARRDRRLRHARQGREHPPHATAATSASSRRAPPSG